jgi:2-polyprenyl-3-methyl-5-hydroxy-6-metoxy-1,4-benzoquinol methylase
MLPAVIRESTDWYQLAGWIRLCDYVETSERTEIEVDRLIDLLPAIDHERVLDVACGTGRIARHLARSGYAVTGIDSSEIAIELARLRIQAGNAPRFAVGDMRDLHEFRNYDAVLCLFNSFGYYDDRTNRRVLLEFAASARPNGIVVLTVPNIWRLASRTNAREWIDLGEGIYYLQEHTFDLLSSRYEATWHFVHVSGRLEVAQVTSRCYTPAELTAMMAAAGLSVEKVVDAPSGASLDPDSRELMIVSRRSGRDVRHSNDPDGSS